MDPYSFPWLLEQLEKWIGKLSAIKVKRKAEEDAALKAFLNALTETQVYLGRIETNASAIKRIDEENLARLWSAAAIAVRSVNPELAQHCLIKGEHWAQTPEWRQNMPETKKSRIKIKAMMRQANELLHA